jgi:hypothetical protein
MKMSWSTALTVLVALGVVGAGAHWARSQAAGQEPAAGASAAKPDQPWRGIHLLSDGRGDLPLLKRAIVEKLAPMGVNFLILEVNYNFEFRSHPELKGGERAWRVEDARDLAESCQKNNVRLIPMLNCLGHQSWASTTAPLLSKHPEFDESPAVPEDNKGIYCRSWCPLHPGVNKVVFDLIDELKDAFRADAIHVGMDEVFILADASCPRCKGKDPAVLFAKCVNDLHGHVVGERKLTMLMWADRLLDDKQFGYGKYESSRNGTAGAIDDIAKDIILCDWHYETRSKGYPSVAYLQEKGFRVLPSTWHNKEAALAMLREARAGATPRMIGHLCTTWGGSRDICRALLDEQPAEPPKPKAKSGRGRAREVVAALKACMDELKEK